MTLETDLNCVLIPGSCYTTSFLRFRIFTSAPLSLSLHLSLTFSLSSSFYPVSVSIPSFNFTSSLYREDHPKWSEREGLILSMNRMEMSRREEREGLVDAKNVSLFFPSSSYSSFPSSSRLFISPTFSSLSRRTKNFIFILLLFPFSGTPLPTLSFFLFPLKFIRLFSFTSMRQRMGRKKGKKRDETYISRKWSSDTSNT